MEKENKKNTREGVPRNPTRFNKKVERYPSEEENKTKKTEKKEENNSIKYSGGPEAGVYDAP